MPPDKETRAAAPPSQKLPARLRIVLPVDGTLYTQASPGGNKGAEVAPGTSRFCLPAARFARGTFLRGWSEALVWRSRSQISIVRPLVWSCHKFLNGSDVKIGLEQMAGKTVTEGMSRGPLNDFGFFDSPLNGFLNMSFVEMRSTGFVGFGHLS